MSARRMAGIALGVAGGFAAALYAVRRATKPAPVLPDAVEVWLGTSLAEPANQASLKADVEALRTELAAALGIRLPAVTFRARPSSNPGAFWVSQHGVDWMRGEVSMDRALVLAPPESLAKLPVTGTPAVHPCNGARLTWIPADMHDLVYQRRLPVRRANDWVALEVAAQLQLRAADFLDVDETRRLLNNVHAPELCRVAVDDGVGVVILSDILKLLVAEQVPLHDMKRVLACIARNLQHTRDAAELAEFVRQALAETLCSTEAAAQASPSCARINVWLVEQALGLKLEGLVRGTGAKSWLELEAEQTLQILDALQVLVAAQPDQRSCVLLTTRLLRRHLRALTSLAFPWVRVMAFEELHPRFNINPAGSLGIP